MCVCVICAEDTGYSCPGTVKVRREEKKKNVAALINTSDLRLTGGQRQDEEDAAAVGARRIHAGT